MNIKLIALDLDDTLVDSKKDLSKRDVTAIKKAMDKGIYVCLASGRTYKSLKPFYKRLGLNSMTISTGGAIINDKDGNRIYEKFLPEKEAAQIVKYAYNNGYHAQVYFKDDFHYYNKDSKFPKLYEKRTGLAGTYDRSIIEMDEIKTPKILFIDDEDKIEEMTKIISEKFSDLSLKNSYPSYIEVNHKDANKGVALKVLVEMLGIKKSDVMAIGDSEIDLSMIEYAGMGVCVENASDNIKKHADFITATCKDDGVAVAIEKFCLYVWWHVKRG